jgi:hypothetical protein
MSLAVAFALCANLAACSSSENKKMDVSETSAEKVTSLEETTTEIETEEETTEEDPGNYEGSILTTSEIICNNLNGFVISPGDTIVLNDLYSDTSMGDLARGNFLHTLYLILDMDTSYLDEKYANDMEDYVVTEEENYIFEYTGDKVIMFEYINYFPGNGGNSEYWVIAAYSIDN